MKRLKIVLFVLFLSFTYGCGDFLDDRITTTPPPPVPVLNAPNDSVWANLSSTDNVTVIETKVLLDLTFQNVGQGDSIFIEHGPESALVDCGDSLHGDGVRRYLGRRGISVLKYLFITHTDEDHLGGCADILSGMQVLNVVVDGQTRDTDAYRNMVSRIDTENLVVAKVGDSFDVDSVKLKVLQANRGSSDANQNSIVLRVDYYNFSALLTGDCDRDCEDNLLLGDIDVDILKVAHHGSNYGTSPEFLFMTSPDYAIISVGINNYGHPGLEVLDRLKKANVTAYRTDDYSYVSILADRDDYMIKVR